MAERQPGRRRKKRDDGPVEKPTDEETAIGKHLRFNLATKTSNFMGHKVEYFTGSKAVDLMLDSKWATGKGNTEILFTTRSSVVHYLDRLLHKGMFHRALKVVKKNKKEEKKEKEGKKEEKTEKDVKKGETKSKKEKGDKKEIKEKPEKEITEKDEGSPKSKKNKEGKRKIKLEHTEDQVFRDGNDAYVWIYDPIKPMYYVYGLLLVVGAIAVCLFPLWPPWMRAGTYYLSLGGAGLVGTVVVLAIIRLILFVLLWSGSMGRIHLWIFPNLLADVGILDSFQPFYECNAKKPDTDSTKEKTLAEGEEEEEKAKMDEEEKAEEEAQDAEEVLAPSVEAGEDVEEDKIDEDDEDDDEKVEEDGSGSSSNPDNREEFEIIEPEDISATSEETES
ncbi:translocation protein SEC62-like [Acanthaster planci]|uniref:Translocation protein SEC62 n=1 Tax=Acanthaster planci TaxID=133434 RepID=A0A8B7YAY6_ACAPL|nr:translocation protein SEC62-like [Acanthaster planci]